MRPPSEISILRLLLTYIMNYYIILWNMDNSKPFMKLGLTLVILHFI